MMQPNYLHRTLALLVLAITVLTMSQNAISGTNQYMGDRFTDTGKKDANGVTIVRWDQGTLFVSQGFIPITTAEASASEFNLSQATLNDINGKFVDLLSVWTAYSQQPGYLDAFQRSNATYSIKGVPYVIITVKGSSGNEPGNSCSSTVTTITDGIPVVMLSTPQPNASEAGPINGRFQIDLDAPRAIKTIVSLTVSGSASNGKDYKKIKNSVTIPAGTTSAFIDILTVNDSKKETAETVNISLNPAATYTLSNASTATINIADND